MRYLASLSALVGICAAHGYVKNITIDGTVYPGFDPRLDYQYSQKRIGWGFSGKASAQGLGPVLNFSSPDVACRFNPITPPALIAPARAGAEVVYKWTDYFGSHQGPIYTYMGQLSSPNQKPTEVDWFKIHESTYDPKTGLWGNDILRKNAMTVTVQIPSDLKAGDYVMRHEIVALHYAAVEGRGAETLPSCLNVRVIGNGTAVPQDTVKFPGAYKQDMPGFKINVYNHENAYQSPGPKVYAGEYKKPEGSPPVVKETGVGSGPQWEAYKRIQSMLNTLHEATINNDDKTNPGGGGCKWEPGADPSTAVCTPQNGGHDFKATATNAYGQFDLKKPKAAAPKAAAPKAAAPKVPQPFAA